VHTCNDYTGNAEFEESRMSWGLGRRWPWFNSESLHVNSLLIGQSS